MQQDIGNRYYNNIYYYHNNKLNFKLSNMETAFVIGPRIYIIVIFVGQLLIIFFNNKLLLYSCGHALRVEMEPYFRLTILRNKCLKFCCKSNYHCDSIVVYAVCQCNICGYCE